MLHTLVPSIANHGSVKLISKPFVRLGDTYYRDIYSIKPLNNIKLMALAALLVPLAPPFLEGIHARTLVAIHWVEQALG
jgi:hypothetical protein